MRAPLSVVIPTLNAAASLPVCLQALMEGVQADLIREVIVTDGGSADEAHKVAEAWGATFITGPASRGGQLRRGCAAARGDWLLVLHADTVLEPGWAEAVIAHLPSGHAGYFKLRFDVGGRVVAGWANLRSRWFGLPYGDQGLVLPRALYDRSGGYPDQPLMEDVALARALRGSLRPLPGRAVTSAARYRAQGWLRRGARNWWLLGRYLLGADPAQLARQYD
ncbi:MAG: TIGR04283 family arsenosugar biosynthesis glycosyltransferase [Pseudomonadota bacterium]